jgi:BirA family biotin operon repressor/biotin-[acetyl-CoA-carboxylase] ligase
MKVNLYTFDEVSSTNTKVKELIADNLKKEFAVIAKKQTEGRGRRGHKWLSPEGGLYLSIVIRPDCATDRINRLYIIAGYCLAKVLKELTQKDIKIKWPNDIIYNNKKLGGILIETSVVNDKVDYAIIGIGVNINCNSNQLPDNSVNLSDITDKDISIEDAAIKIISEFSRDRGYLGENFEELIKKWQEYCDIINKKVKITYTNKEVEGKVRGLDKETGGLVVGREVVSDLVYEKIDFIV